MIIKCYDIETIWGEFSITIHNPDGTDIREFRVNKLCNQLDGMVRYLTTEKVDYWVGFNNINFDAQVLTWIIENKDKWVNKSREEICMLIAMYADDLINDINNNIFPPYRERQLWATQIDLFKIHHFDNESKRTSLKWCEFMMDLPNIEEMPWPHTRVDLGLPEFAEIDKYRRNDVTATCRLLDYTRGNCENEEYKGKDMLQMRWDTIETYKLPREAISWSDVKMGDELNKLSYMKLTGIKNPRELIEMKRRRKGRVKFTYGDCIPEYVTFKTKEFQQFYTMMKKVPVDIKKKIEYPFLYNKTQYMIAKGGIHSIEKNRIIEPSEDEILRDADIGSQYPWSIIKRKLFPSHLGDQWLIGYESTYDSRIADKKRSQQEGISKEDKRKFKGLSEMKKLQLNGGGLTEKSVDFIQFFLLL